jgi:hypothetical protein
VEIHEVREAFHAGAEDLQMQLDASLAILLPASEHATLQVLRSTVKNVCMDFITTNLYTDLNKIRMSATPGLRPSARLHIGTASQPNETAASRTVEPALRTLIPNNAGEGSMQAGNNSAEWPSPEAVWPSQVTLSTRTSGTTVSEQSIQSRPATGYGAPGGGQVNRDSGIGMGEIEAPEDFSDLLDLDKWDKDVTSWIAGEQHAESVIRYSPGNP